MLATLRWWLAMAEFDYAERYWEQVALSERWLYLITGDGR
jgi:hypothetical protein